jgi:hypothetical protein
MKQLTRLQSTKTLITLAALMTIFAFRPFSGNDCNCDKEVTEKTIKSKEFNRMPKFDDTLIGKDFYDLSAEDNRTLWYRDVESPEETKFTSLWNDYARNNYHASHLDFLKYYQDKQDIELAFQFGPNGDLWAYHIFVVKKVDCCYLITRSYFRHARFTSKRYAILDKPQLDSLFAVIGEQKIAQIDTVETFDYCGYFRDNRNKKSFYINFEKSQVRVTDKQDTARKYMETPPEINKLYEFVDDKIKWTKTY